jgi:hypothetical protein
MVKYTWEDMIKKMNEIGSTNLKVETLVDVVNPESSEIVKSILDLDRMYYWIVEQGSDDLWFVKDQGSAI